MRNKTQRKMDPFIAASLISAGTAAAQGIQQGGPRRQYKWNKRAAQDANAMNRENQQWLLEQNRELQREQREYDSPEAQKKRYIEAGLNPNLIYGSPTSAGSAFPIDAGQVPGARVDPPDASFPDVAGAFIRSGQAVLGGVNTAARTQESLMRTQAIELQNEIARTNPMLRPEVAAAVADSLESTAAYKARDARIWMNTPNGEEQSRQWQKINNELEATFQRLGLNTADLQIKNKILESKEFENVIKELNAKWLKDSQVTPEHIRQGLMLILQKMIR